MLCTTQTRDRLRDPERSRGGGGRNTEDGRRKTEDLPSTYFTTSSLVISPKLALSASIATTCKSNLPGLTGVSFPEKVLLSPA